MVGTMQFNLKNIQNKSSRPNVTNLLRTDSAYLAMIKKNNKKVQLKVGNKRKL